MAIVQIASVAAEPPLWRLQRLLLDGEIHTHAHTTQTTAEKVDHHVPCAQKNSLDAGQDFAKGAYTIITIAFALVKGAIATELA